jgi:hypothetical protein
VIDCRVRAIVPHPEGEPYAALSYVWGQKNAQSGNASSQSFPRTISDAIDVTRTLGMKYLWADQFCID